MSGSIADNPYRASGVVAAAGGGGVSWQDVTTGTTLTAEAGNGYPINTTSNACTVTLPTSASVGDEIIFTDYARTWATNALTISSSLNYQGSSSIDPEYGTDGESVHIVYQDVTQGWIPINDGAVAYETNPEYTIEWLVIGSGATGGTYYRSGGGGAGGYRNSYASEQSGRLSSGEPAWTEQNPGDGDITVVIGAGAQSPGLVSNGTNGESSSIAAAGETTVESYGGGGGGRHGDGDANVGTFGSGGGAGNHDQTTPGGPSTAGQGFDGGACAANPEAQGAGGGGAGQLGHDDVAPSDEMDGGDGMASSITGASVYRAGGGGAGGYTEGGHNGEGGAGGGGDGGLGLSAPATYPTNAVPTGSPAYNSGAGGGGAAGNLGSNGLGDGDDGVVFLRMPTTGYSETTSGSPTVIVDGADTVLVFEGDGTYTR